MVFEKMNKKLKSLLLNEQVLDTYVSKPVSLSFLLFPFFLLLLIVIFFFIKDAFSVEAYVHIQKDLFIYLNSKFSKFPILQFNITQLGNILIVLPFLSIFMVYAPKFWEILLTSLLVSVIFQNLLKPLFAVPRPAAMFDNDSFVIIGKTLHGNTSLPSGHSIATFTILISVLFAFMPQKLGSKILWSLFIFSAGLIIAFTRVGVGAHYPFDVIIGSIIGYISALAGIFIYKKFNMWNWLTNKKYYFISIFLFLIWAITLILKIASTNLIIFYFSLLSLVATLFTITYIYVKKKY